MMAGFPAHAGMDPAQGASERRGRAASPHTRGWTRSAVSRLPPGGGFPAHAGMDPRARGGRAVRPRLPRTRGDGPPTEVDCARCKQASPHTRGWTRTPAGHPGRHPGFPAHAGMDPSPAASGPARSRLPRTRGDGPLALTLRLLPYGASPHTRGWTLVQAGADLGAPGFPAHAGMDPDLTSAVTMTVGLPRTRGDGPAPPSVVRGGHVASPHTRGWTRGGAGGDGVVGGFPAHAGMDPHRGATERASREGFPAHAGMDRHATRPSRSRRRLPRTRGDGPVPHVTAAAVEEASPHTRGWTVDRVAGFVRQVGFPAHAGMDPERTWASASCPRLPRTRGDGPLSRSRCARITMASPHTRGWTLGGRPDPVRAVGFPAHAGMDPACTPRTRGRGWLPRTRGDGPASRSTTRFTAKASPHTRGWTLSLRPGA